jgi:hypothetical protein
MTAFYGHKTAFFDGLLKANRKLELEYELAVRDASESAVKVRSVAANFLEDYADFNHISVEAASASYMETNRRYVRDIQAFIATGKYPLEIDPTTPGLGRADYDLSLILSILVMPHRCAIMEEIMKTSVPGKPLVIGVGSGIELGFIPAPEGGDAYDLYINPFARQIFPEWNFHEELYRPSGPRYGSVYAIELLEHLSEPYRFIADCREALSPGGRFVTTTASNLPQFDHRYNFVSDKDFEDRVCGSGFELESKRVIPHEYRLMGIRAKDALQARNVFYVFRKKD